MNMMKVPLIISSTAASGHGLAVAVRVSTSLSAKAASFAEWAETSRTGLLFHPTTAVLQDHEKGCLIWQLLLSRQSNGCGNKSA